MVRELQSHWMFLSRIRDVGEIRLYEITLCVKGAFNVAKHSGCDGGGGRNGFCDVVAMAPARKNAQYSHTTHVLLIWG